MLLKKLTPQFFADNNHLVEVLDKRNGQWDGEKTRGYGIVLVSHNALQFGIPLRSRIKHQHCFITVQSKGLDYSKSVLLTDQAYISAASFQIPADEFIKIKDREHFIQAQFSKYVDRYVLAVRRSDQNILTGYRFSTLQNYHRELGI